MTAKTNAANQAAYRARKAAAGLAEVRGIFAPLEDHPPIKREAARITGRSAKPAAMTAAKK